MRTVFAFFLLTVLLVAGCKSESPAEISQPVSIPKAAVKKPSSFISRVTSLDGASPVNDLKQRQAIRQFYTGMNLRREGKIDDAINAFVAALKTDPLHLPARYQLAITLAQKKDAGNALAVLQAFGSAKSCPRCYVMLAKAKDHPAFAIFDKHTPFHALVDKPAARLKQEMAAADWISYDRDALAAGKMVFAFNGLPAISANGKRILAVNLEEDSDGRTIGATLQTLDAKSGERTGGKGILFSMEGERLISGKSHHREIRRLLDDRIAQIHEELISEKWLPMTVSFEEPATELKPCGHAQKADVSGMSVTLSDMKLTISDAEGNETLEREAKPWLPRRHEVCATTPVIRRIYTQPEHKSLLMELAYCSPACQSRKMKWTAVSY